ncbi:recombinase, putative [Cyanobium sp. PCC 7001]|uniref:recombinase family protein n=1 Tax=Cyanobium sp. PCC 7001 TaxID=180281 RepID=UPI0001805BDE|nr:recombinase family protein [Cyanobium sp. PCC 7001]EDY39131.1 recombinase, putative [Cyanobium sp. PCC 7001]
MPVATRRCFSYARVSSGHQAQLGEGLQRQLAQAEAWAAAHDLVLDDTLDLIDPGRSASKGHHIREGAALHRFLAAAKAGTLGSSPVLLIEDFTRLSRLEPLDALDQIVSPLVRSGVEIVTLEDGASYTLDRLNRDPACLLILVVKAQSAAEYARRLSSYITQRRAANRADILDGKPVCTGWAPSWIEWNAEGQRWQFTPYASTVRRLVELSWEHGTTVVCRTLNAEGHRSPDGLPWSQMPIRAILRNPALHGARRTAAPGHAAAVKAWRAECSRLIKQHGSDVTLPPKPKRTYALCPDTFPAILTADEHEALLAVIKARAVSPQEKGRRDRTHYIGQQLTTCLCGAPVGARSVKPRKHSGLPGDQRYIYLVCRGRERKQTDCQAPPIRVEPIHAALLTRLQGDALAQLQESGGDGPLAALLVRQGHLIHELTQAESRHNNAAAALRDRAMAGAAVIEVYEQAVTEAAAVVAATREALAGVAAEIRAIQNQPSAGAAAEQVQALLQTFARGEDTPDQRRAINSLLRRLQVRIYLDTEAQRLGLAVGDAEPRWQPLAPGLAQKALEQGRVGTGYLTATITPEDLQRAAEQAEGSGLESVQVPAEFFGQLDQDIPAEGNKGEADFELQQG